MSLKEWLEGAKEFFQIMGSIILFILALCIPMVVPVVYMDGRAKSVYIKHVKGIDIPWYQATFLDVKVQDVNADVTSHESDR